MKNRRGQRPLPPTIYRGKAIALIPQKGIVGLKTSNIMKQPDIGLALKLNPV